MRKAGMTQVGIIPGKYEKHGQIYDAVCYELTVKNTEPLTADEYQKKAMTTLNPELDKKDVLINGVMGLCGESGEAIDIVKKWMAHGHELDKEHLAKELGDIAWYLAEAATALDMDLEDIADEWSRYNGVIKYRAKDGVKQPEQVVARNFNVGQFDMMNMQMRRQSAR